MKILILILILFFLLNNQKIKQTETIKIEDKEITAIKCSSFLSKFKGLMFSPKKNLLFEFSTPSKPIIHMFFVFYPIKIYYLDEDKNILDKIIAKPFHIYKTKYPSKYILETPI